MTQRGRVLRLLNKPDACIEVMQPGLAEARREQTLVREVRAIQVRCGMQTETLAASQ